MVTKAKAKIDLTRQRPEFFDVKETPELVTLGPARYLTLEGIGAPESAAFQDAVAAIYEVVFTLRAQQRAQERDFKVSHLEALWWPSIDDGDEDPGALWSVPREDWRWKLLIMVPDFVDEARAHAAIIEARTKRGLCLAVKLEVMVEGLCAQVLHVGPYGDETRSIEKLRSLLRRKHLRAVGPHHEVYLTDPRRMRRDNLRTALRHPVAGG